MRTARLRMRGGMAFSGICLVLLCAIATAKAGNLNDLLDQKNLTPEALARVAANFTFELNPQLQAPETFLQRERGDCADFANLASIVLTHGGYTTKLVVVMMSKQTHVVCYVKEAGGFLDYNHRSDAHPVIASNGSLEDIADKVASDFRAQWQMTSAIRYRENSPVYLDSVFASGSSSARKVGRSIRKRAVNMARATLPTRSARSADTSIASVPVQAIIN
jgi:hypothetical protein